MNDLLDALKTRLSSPIFGYFSLALLAFNWQSFFYLVVQEGDALARIEYFEQHTTLHSLVTLPLSFSLVFSVLYPWVVFFVAWMTAKPTEMKDMVQANSEHNILLRRKQLEEARSSLLASTELELIERAKRDQEIDKLHDEELREKLKDELEQLRAERDSRRGDQEPLSVYAKHKELMDIANNYRKQAEVANSINDRESFNNRARQIETQAHELLMKHEITGEKYTQIGNKVDGDLAGRDIKK